MANPEHLKILKDGGVNAWNAWRDKDNIVADLSDANLVNGDLAGINFAGARLHSVMFNAANLKGARFNGAKLIGSSFAGVNLSNADFTHAQLDFVSFLAAYLVSANFFKSELGFTSFANSNLKEATNLETCLHLAPSSVDAHTLMRSGLLPEKFLKGCRLPAELIRINPSYLEPANAFYSCFISYSHQDQEFAQKLYFNLRENGIKCWMDEHQLMPGDDLHEGIGRGIWLWDKMLLCASKASLNSWWVNGEITRAFQKEAQIMGERGKEVLVLIPLNLDGFLFSREYQNGKKAEITSRFAANFVGWENEAAIFDQALAKLICALRADDAGRENPPPPKL